MLHGFDLQSLKSPKIKAVLNGGGEDIYEPFVTGNANEDQKKMTYQLAGTSKA